MRALPLFHRIAGKPVIVVGQGDAADAKRRMVERAGGLPANEDDLAARLAFVALEAEAEVVAERLRARGLLVNVVDRPELCDFTVPSLIDRDPLLVAVGTAGASAGLAKHVRLRLERVLPARLGALAEALFAARGRLRERYPDAAARRRALDAALAEGSALDPLREDASERLAGWLNSSAAGVDTQTIEFALSSNDPDDLTLRQARWLGVADAVMFDPGVSASILDRARADAVRLPLPYAGIHPAGTVVVLRFR